MKSTKTRVLSVSRRTDIPAHYWDWFKNRVRNGFCIVKNPFNPKQEKKILLTPEEVDVFVFWTRNSEEIPEDKDFFNFLKENYHFYFLYTITGYPHYLEPNLPPVEKCIDSFKTLSRLMPKGTVIWRYDPVFINDEMDFDYHLSNFNSLSARLNGFANRVIISFFDPYKKTIKRLANAGISFWSREEIFNDEKFHDFMAGIRKSAEKAGMEPLGCCEDFTPYGIKKGACIDGELIKNLFKLDIKYKKDKSQRKNCGCIESTDIGAYDTCIHGCLYCYAVRNFEKTGKKYEGFNKSCDSIC